MNNTLEMENDAQDHLEYQPKVVKDSDKSDLYVSHRATNLTIDTLNPEPRTYSVRSQADNLGDYYAWASALHTGDETLVRQEFRDEADINILLGRFGVNVNQRQAVFGQELDYNLDLQTAIEAADAGKKAWAAQPEELRQRYPSFRHMVDAIESGEYEQAMQKVQQRREMEREWQERQNQPVVKAEDAPKPQKKEPKKETPEKAED